MPDQINLVGTWSLESFTIKKEGDAPKTWNEDTTGLIIYTNDGYVSVAINSKTDKSKNLIDTLLFYTGTYIHTKNRVYHKVRHATKVERIGQTLERELIVHNDNKISLVGRGSFGVAEIIWTRMRSSVTISKMTQTECEKEFEVAVEEFFYSVSTKDFETFLKYILLSEDFFAELPGDIVIFNAKDFLENQKPWFNKLTGRFSYEIQKISCTEKEGLSEVNVVYSDIDETGNSFTKNIRIEMAFKKVDGQWVLVRNINKVLSES